MRTRIVAAIAAVAALGVSTVVLASSGDVIETSTTGPVGAIGLPSGQNFRPQVSGSVARVTIWAVGTTGGQAGEVVVHRGDRPGDEIGRQGFTWDGSQVTVELVVPVPVIAGQVYTVTTTGAQLQHVFGGEDPYPDGEATLQTARGWQTWTEWNGCGTGGFCLPYLVDQRIMIEITDEDGDGDGVSDAEDVCPDTVLPDPSVAELRPNRFAATPAGFVDADGNVVGSLADAGGCSAAQIVEAMGLGAGVLRFGLTRPHLDAWIASL